MKATSEEIQAEKEAARLLRLPKDVLLTSLQALLFEKSQDEIFFSKLASIVKEIEGGHMTSREKFKNRWSRLEKWLETKLLKDPSLTPWKLAGQFCYVAKKGYREKRLIYKIAVRVKNKLRVRRSRLNKSEGASHDQ
jgi:hypothetical protein